MALKTDLTTSTRRLLAAKLEDRQGRVIPTTKQISFEAGSVKLNAVFLYADLASSTRLVRDHGQVVASKVVKSFLSSMNRLVKATGGEVRSFDGDRVMGVFVGNGAATAASICALKMHWTVQHIIRVEAEKRFPSLQSKGFVIRHCAGAASGNVRVVRGGIRKSSDLVFVGIAPNIAAKLSEIRNRSWCSYVTADVWRDMDRSAKVSADGSPAWERVSRVVDDRKLTLYRSSDQRSP